MPSLISTIGLSAAAFYAGAENVKRSAASLGDNIRSSLGAKLAGVLSFAAIGQAMGNMMELGGRVQDLSNKLGIGAEAVQQWDYALKQNGSTIESAVPFFQKLAQVREKALGGNDKAISDFQRLGVSLEMLKNSRVEDIGATIAKAFEVGDPQQLLAPLVAVGGKGAMAMAAAFRDGLADALSEAPLVSAESIASLDAAADSMSRLRAEGTSTFAPIVAWVADATVKILDLGKIISGTLVGSVMGAYEAFTNLSAVDLLHPAKALLKLGKGSLDGAQEMTMDLLNDKLDRDDAAKAKRERLAKGNRGLFDPSDIEEKTDKIKEDTTKKKAEAEAKRAADKAKREADKIARDEVKFASDVQSQIAKDEMEAGKLGKHSVGGNQSFGGFAGNFALAAGPEMAAMTATIRMEDHLRQIREHLLKKKTSSIAPDADVEFE